MKKLIPLMFILMSQANADCTPKDLTDPEYLKSMGKENLIEHFKIPRDQDSVGWCGAFAPADSLSFAVGEAVSPIDVSINYYTSRNRAGSRLETLAGIGVLAATDQAKKEGYCPESVIPSNQTSTSNLGQSALLQLMQTFQKIHDDYVAKGRPADYCVNCIEGYEKVIKPTLPGATANVIRDVLQKNQSDSLTAFQDLLNKLCEGRRVVVNPETSIMNKNSSTRSLVSAIDKALDDDSMPNFVMNTSYFANLSALPGGHGEHALMVVGRRMGSNGKCEYQIRNSWGKGCSYYQPAIAAKCDAAKGSFWMDEDRLQDGATTLVVVKNDKNRGFAKKQEEQKAPILNNGSGESKPAEENKISENNNSNNNNSSNNNNIDTNKNNDSNSKPSFGQNVDTFLAKASETASKVAVEVADTAKKVAAGLAEAVSSIWKSLSNAFKY